MHKYSSFFFFFFFFTRIVWEIAAKQANQFTVPGFVTSLVCCQCEFPSGPLGSQLVGGLASLFVNACVSAFTSTGIPVHVKALTNDGLRKEWTTYLLEALNWGLNAIFWVG